MPPGLRNARYLALLPAAGIACAAFSAEPTRVSRDEAIEPEPEPRPAASPAELAALLERYDRMSAGREKDTLAARIDAVAHQKYATVSRLYWHTSWEAAQAAAREQHRPILHLRMLGRLDEDLSCANSRFFRTTLYANPEVSQLLRERFVLVWSSERAVPRVTIDFGDGRKLERTTTGNSAHYVMDADGNVIDVLPGLYAAQAFRRELETSLSLVSTLDAKSKQDRARAIAAHHDGLSAAAATEWQAVRSRRGDRLAVIRAQRATITKAAVELPEMPSIVPTLPAEATSAEEVAMWEQAARALYHLEGKALLDEHSRALIKRLHEAVPADLRAGPAALGGMIARLEQHIAADTGLNQLRVRPQISREIVRRGGQVRFGELNRWVYATVFHTPSSDPWLGLLTRTDFTGLPGDGVVMR